jgi:hypothetical protein
MPAEEIIPTVSMSNIYIGLCLPNALTLAQLRSYELFRHNKRVGLRRILSISLLRDMLPHRLGIEMPLKEGVPSLYNPWSELHPLIFAE